MSWNSHYVDHSYIVSWNRSPSCAKFKTLVWPMSMRSCAESAGVCWSVFHHWKDSARLCVIIMKVIGLILGSECRDLAKPTTIHPTADNLFQTTRHRQVVSNHNHNRQVSLQPSTRSYEQQPPPREQSLANYNSSRTICFKLLPTTDML